MRATLLLLFGLLIGGAMLSKAMRGDEPRQPVPSAQWYYSHPQETARMVQRCKTDRTLTDRECRPVDVAREKLEWDRFSGKIR